METESEMKIKALRADRGGEYLSDDIQSFLEFNQNSQQPTHPSKTEYQNA